MAFPLALLIGFVQYHSYHFPLFQCSHVLLDFAEYYSFESFAFHSLLHFLSMLFVPLCLWAIVLLCSVEVELSWGCALSPHKAVQRKLSFVWIYFHRE